MKRVRQAAASMAAMCWLMGSAWAAPRVALVIPIQGDVKLAGAKLSSPKIAEEGQLVSLSNGAEVRIQLLGSSKEKVLKGKSDYTITKSSLDKEGKSLDRGKVSVTSEIGNLSRSGAATSRAAVYTPVGLAFKWPPVLEKDQWVTPTVTPLEKVGASEKTPIVVTVSDLTDPKARILETTITEAVPSLVFAQKDLVVGHQYRIDVQSESGDRGYHREFRILSKDEQDNLQETERVLRMTAIASDEMPTLIRLATLYKGFARTDKMVDVLVEAVNKPSFKTLDPTVQLQLMEVLNSARNSLDLENYQPN